MPDDVTGQEPPEEAPEQAPVEELSPSEEATGLQEAVAAVRERRRAIDAMPDGPRPRAPGETYKRRQVFVDWQLQVNYVGVYLSVTALLVVGFAALNYVFASFYERAIEVQRQQPLGEHNDMFLLATLNVVFLLLLVIGMAVHAIIQSHRIAGPVYRFRRALHALRGRDYDFYVQLRSKDYLKDLAEQVNGLTTAMKAKDLVIADAALALEQVAKDHPDAAEALGPVTANLCDLVLPFDEVDDGNDDADET